MSDIDIMRVLAGGPGAASGASATFEGAQEGLVHHVDSSGVYFTLPSWSDSDVFGPARWHAATTVDVSGGSGEPAFAAHHHDIAAPAVGQLCVVVFVGAGVNRPWIVAWADA